MLEKQGPDTEERNTELQELSVSIDRESNKEVRERYGRILTSLVSIESRLDHVQTGEELVDMFRELKDLSEQAGHEIISDVDAQITRIIVSHMEYLARRYISPKSS